MKRILLYQPTAPFLLFSQGVQPMKYGSKELDREGGLDLYDSLARWYDPFRCQTTTQDPLAEKCYNLSPYLWCAGNPIANTDPSGMKFIGKDNEIANEEMSILSNLFMEQYNKIKVRMELSEEVSSEDYELCSQLFLSMLDIYSMQMDK